MKTLRLAVKAEYFDAIRDGEKKFEYRLRNDHWSKRLIGKKYDWLIITKGYPRNDEHDKILEGAYKGRRCVDIQHDHFGEEMEPVFAIPVSHLKLREVTP